MESKKLYFLITLAVLAIVSSGLASACTIGYTGGADPIRGIAIERIEFNIPEGYVKNDTRTIINETGTNGNNSFVLNQQTYENYKGEEITISVVNYDDFDVDAQTLQKLCEGTDEKNKWGYPGFITRNDTSTRFTYAYDNRAVSITAPNEDIINEIIVIEDA